jgi:Dolichyl-phosphate-mannose-protein mannosyltransferase
LRLVRIALPLFVLLGAVYAWVVPPGEAPDEPAHLAYVDHIVAEGSLPPARPTRDLTGYERYQPPLDYLVSAVLLRVLHGGPVDYPFRANPGFDFHTFGSRAFLARTGTESQVRAIRRLRVARLFWGVLTLWLTVQVARILAGPGREGAIAAVAPFCLAPQLLFDTATINNDTAVTALASATIYGLCRMVSKREEEGLPGALTGTVAGLALWAKASGLFLVLPMLYAGVVLWRRGQRRAVAGLLFSFAAVAAGWLAFTLVRSGPVLVGPEPGGAAPGWVRLITEPAWPASVWISFWGKFGWLNLRLPAPIYLFFLPPTLLVLWGVGSTVRAVRGNAEGAISATVALLAAISNLGLLLAYLAGVDWQLQGRYLLPSVAALAGLAAKGYGDLGGRLRFFPSLAPFVVLVYAAIAALGGWWIARVYAPGF